MPTREQRQLVPITADARRVIREVRGRVGLSRWVLEQRAKLGKGYVKDVELGRTQRAEIVRFKRLLQVVQQVATHGQVPTKVTAGIARVLKSMSDRDQREPRSEQPPLLSSYADRRAPSRSPQRPLGVHPRDDHSSSYGAPPPSRVRKSTYPSHEPLFE